MDRVALKANLGRIFSYCLSTYDVIQCAWRLRQNFLVKLFDCVLFDTSLCDQLNANMLLSMNSKMMRKL